MKIELSESEILELMNCIGWKINEWYESIGGMDIPELVSFRHRLEKFIK